MLIYVNQKLVLLKHNLQFFYEKLLYIIEISTNTIVIVKIHLEILYMDINTLAFTTINL